ncbi:transaldolase, partial [Streptomyces sp. SID7982]|nr:transaldolase [Streptomyces sp. SID7982]
ACDVLRDVDGFVSMPVGAPAARREASPGDWITSARVLRGGVDRPNLLVGLPADATGIRALAGCLEEGISVDSSPCYTVEQYAEVLDAQLTGLETALSAGVDPSALVV